jgi:NAD(P)H-flavin reductase
MSSAKGKILRFRSGVVLRRGTVIAARDIGGFQRLVVRCERLHVADGQTVQNLLPSDDTRTYTPIPSPGGMVLLGWKAAGGPGSHWLSNARPGDELAFVAPQRSLELDAGPVVLVGDETSVAVAAAFATERPGQTHAVIHADAAFDVRAAADSVGLYKIDVVARGDLHSLVDAVVT